MLARGFTLVEMLVVIVIIGILAALITAAAATALSSAKQTRIKVEVDQLAAAMEAFKQKYGAYPPANLSCLQDTSGNYVCEHQLTSFVARAFPRYAVATAGLPTIPYQIAWDLQNAGVDVSIFNPQVSLVFWLSGFGPDPTDPFNRNNQVVTRTPFFSFDQAQLVAWQVQQLNSNGNVTGFGMRARCSGRRIEYRNVCMSRSRAAVCHLGVSVEPRSHGLGQLVYNAPYGNAAYCYFDYQSYGRFRTPSRWHTAPRYIGIAAPTNSTYNAQPLAGRNCLGRRARRPPRQCRSVVKPQCRVCTVYPALQRQRLRHALCVRYNRQQQLQRGRYVLQAGVVPDHLRRPGRQLRHDDFSCHADTRPRGHGRLYPDRLQLRHAADLGGSADDDNVTNFCEKSSLDAAKPLKPNPLARPSSDANHFN